MVNTWRESYFKTEGIRVLFVLPRDWTDAAIPMQIRPQPTRVVRVMVGRLELLTPKRERLAEGAVRELTSSDAAARERAFDWLREQGRYVEPILRRVLRGGGDAEVRQVCRRLLATDFVTDLRAAVQSPADGRRVAEDPLYVRAQLAAVLRELGLEVEAKAEAVAVLAELEKRTAPHINQPESRGYLRAYARVMEALGSDQGAAEWYGKFVRFGSQAIQDTSCRFCHAGNGGPTSTAWFRDWWAGKKLAGYLARLGERDRTIAAEEAVLARRPKDAAARLTLAYLYQDAGERERAARTWGRMEESAYPLDSGHSIVRVTQ